MVGKGNKNGHKNQTLHKCGRVVSIPQCPQVSLFHLMMTYMVATRPLVRPGGPHSDFTTTLLYGHGCRHHCFDSPRFIVQTRGDHQGVADHSTIRAGDGFSLKNWPLCQEVSQIGRWSGMQALAPGVKLTQSRQTETGGGDTECETQRHRAHSGSVLPDGEVLLSLPAVLFWYRYSAELLFFILLPELSDSQFCPSTTRRNNLDSKSSATLLPSTNQFRSGIAIRTIKKLEQEVFFFHGICNTPGVQLPTGAHKNPSAGSRSWRRLCTSRN